MKKKRPKRNKKKQDENGVGKLVTNDNQTDENDPKVINFGEWQEKLEESVFDEFFEQIVNQSKVDYWGERYECWQEKMMEFRTSTLFTAFVYRLFFGLCLIVIVVLLALQFNGWITATILGVSLSLILFLVFITCMLLTNPIQYFPEEEWEENECDIETDSSDDIPF